MFTRNEIAVLAHAMLMARPDQVKDARPPLVVAAEFTGWARTVHEVCKMLDETHSGFDSLAFLKDAGHSA